MRGSLSFLALIFFSSLTFGAPSLENLKNKIDGEREALLRTEIKKRGVLGVLYDINKNIHKIKSDADAIEIQSKAAQKSIESYAKVIVKLEKIRIDQKKALRERLRALYKMGLQGYAQVLLSSRTSGEFSRNMKFLKIIAEKDNTLIENYKVNMDMLAAEQKKLREQVKVYAQFQRILKQEMHKYTLQKQRQLYVLSKIDQDRETHLQAIREWRDAGRKLEEKLGQLGSETRVTNDIGRGSFFEQYGFLQPPVLREVLQKYGIVKNAKFNTKIFHKGLFFAARMGDKVTSLFFGKVAYAGWIDGYGETIIVDHGDHYYSLYAHNSGLKKKSGDTVGTGEEIASAGDTGSLRGPGLYLEIRHFSESIDPLPWLDLKKIPRL